MNNEAVYDEVMRLRAKLQRAGEQRGVDKANYYALLDDWHVERGKNVHLQRVLVDRVETGSLFLRPPCDKPHVSRVDAFGTYAVAGLLLSSLVFWAFQVLGG